MHWVEKSSAKAKFAEALMRLPGWTVLGYREDRSDAMVDLFDPAYWNGLAKHESGSILVVDKRHSKYDRDEEVQYQDSKPGHWHVEKNGVIVDSGVGIFKAFYGWGTENLADKQRILDRIDRAAKASVPKPKQGSMPFDGPNGENCGAWNGSFTVGPGMKPGYVEIRFPERPSDGVLSNLKLAGFRWAKFNRCWYDLESEMPSCFRTDSKKPTEAQAEEENAKS